MPGWFTDRVRPGLPLLWRVGLRLRPIPFLDLLLPELHLRLREKAPRTPGQVALFAVPIFGRQEDVAAVLDVLRGVLGSADHGLHLVQVDRAFPALARHRPEALDQLLQLEHRQAESGDEAQVGVWLAPPVELDPQVVLERAVVELPVVPDLLEEGFEEPGHRHVVGVFVVGQFKSAKELRGSLNERPLKDETLLLGSLAAADVTRTSG